jgi:hypothetical protein
VANQPAKSNIRSAKSRRPITAAPRLAKSKRVVEAAPPVQAPPAAEERVAETKRPTKTSSDHGAKLLAAVTEGDQRAVKQLLDSKKLNVNAVDKSGRALLTTAVENGHSDVARELIKAGANVDVRSPSGDTPLIVAARSGDPVIVHMLLEGGADIDARSRSGKTAQAIAKSGGHDVVYEFIADEADRRGKTHGMVAKAQTLLNKLGYKLGRADGVPGPKTVRAVRRFQKSQKIRVDGKITPALITALQRKSERRSSNKTMASRTTRGAESSAKSEPKASAGDQTAAKTDSESGSSESKGWFSRTTSSVSSFLKSAQKATSERTQLCDTARDRWIQDPDGNWIECTNVPNY